MATWKLAPDTGQISGGPHSSMPLVVIPSEIEIGAITLAEAQSSRYYTDSGLVTEVAREVVSSDELHFDGSSVSSSSEYWMDFDGVRSDYGVTDTYGRNAVWGDYEAVYHLNETSGTTAVDSSGNADGTASDTDIFSGAAAGVMGTAADFSGGATRYIDITNLGNIGNLLTFSTWFKTPSATNRTYVQKYNANSTQIALIKGYTGSETELYNNGINRFTIADPTPTNEYIYNTIVKTSDSDYSLYHNGAFVSDVISGATDSNVAAGYIGSPHTTSASSHDGEIDETRIRTGNVSANWITTEYKSQYNNAAFWVATDVSGGGGGGWVGYPMIHMLQFNCVM